MFLKPPLPPGLSSTIPNVLRCFSALQWFYGVGGGDDAPRSAGTEVAVEFFIFTNAAAEVCVCVCVCLSVAGREIFRILDVLKERKHDTVAPPPPPSCTLREPGNDSRRPLTFDVWPLCE